MDAPSLNGTYWPRFVSRYEQCSIICAASLLCLRGASLVTTHNWVSLSSAAYVAPYCCFNIALHPCFSPIPSPTLPAVLRLSIHPASSDGSARLWELARGAAVRVYQGHQKAVVACALNDGTDMVV